MNHATLHVRKKTWGCLLITLLFSSLVLAVPAPGPDSFGHTSSTIALNLRDVSASGTAIALGDDSVSGAIDIGFSFDFYGIAYNQIQVSSNGYIGLGGSGLDNDYHSNSTCFVRRPNVLSRLTVHLS